MCSIGQRYLNIHNYLLHQRCRSVDSVEPIKTKSVEVGILVVRDGLPFTSFRAQCIASIGRRCYSSLICQKLDAFFNKSMDMSFHVNWLVSSSFYLTLTVSSNSSFDSDIYGHPTDQQLHDFQNRLLQQSSCGPSSLSDVAHSIYSELCSQNYLWQEEV